MLVHQNVNKSVQREFPVSSASFQKKSGLPLVAQRNETSFVCFIFISQCTEIAHVIRLTLRELGGGTKQGRVYYNQDFTLSSSFYNAFLFWRSLIQAVHGIKTLGKFHIKKRIDIDFIVPDGQVVHLNVTPVAPIGVTTNSDKGPRGVLVDPRVHWSLAMADVDRIHEDNTAGCSAQVIDNKGPIKPMGRFVEQSSRVFMFRHVCSSCVKPERQRKLLSLCNSNE